MLRLDDRRTAISETARHDLLLGSAPESDRVDFGFALVSALGRRQSTFGGSLGALLEHQCELATVAAALSSALRAHADVSLLIDVDCDEASRRVVFDHIETRRGVVSAQHPGHHSAGAVVIACSARGEADLMLDALRRSVNQETVIVAVTGTASNRLSRAADIAVCIDVAPFYAVVARLIGILMEIAGETVSAARICSD